MVIYEFVADDGERMTVVRSMHNPPGFTIERDGKLFKRDFGQIRTAIPQQGVDHYGLPLSISLPPAKDAEMVGVADRINGQPVVRHPDGTFSCAKTGRWVCRTNAERRRVAEKLGYETE